MKNLNIIQIFEEKNLKFDFEKKLYVYIYSKIKFNYIS